VQLLLELPEQFSLNIAGDLKDQEYATHIRDFTAKSGISDRVRLLGKINQSKIPEFMADNDIILGLSTEETGHYAIAEGMASGCFPAMSYWYGCEGIYPKGNIFFKLSELIKTINGWGKLETEAKQRLAEQAVSYSRSRFDYKINDLDLVNKCKTLL
jgi:glycosyltransferase involved in cell wall biosynthesis